MKIVDQSYEIIEMPGNMLEQMEMAGRTCYKSEDKITPESAERFVEMLVRKGHHAMIEFGDITIKFITNRGVTHELVRHRMGVSFAQESTRYVKYDGEMEFIHPVWSHPSLLKNNWDFFHDEVRGNVTAADVRWRDSMRKAEADYKNLLTEGWKAQQAREVLPNSLKTEIVVKANIREWRHILNLRTAKAAHPQMRALVRPLLAELKMRVPVVFDDIV